MCVWSGVRQSVECEMDRGASQSFAPLSLSSTEQGLTPSATPFRALVAHERKKMRGPTKSMGGVDLKVNENECHDFLDLN